MKHIFRREIPFNTLRIKKSTITFLPNGEAQVTDVLEKDIVRKVVFFKGTGSVKSATVFANIHLKNVIFRIEYLKSGKIRSQYKNKQLFNVVIGLFPNAAKKFYI